MNETSIDDTERSATCQQCSGNVLLEIDFGEPNSQDARILAECDGCGNSAWLSWEEIPARSVCTGTEHDVLKRVETHLEYLLQEAHGRMVWPDEEVRRLEQDLEEFREFTQSVDANTKQEGSA